MYLPNYTATSWMWHKVNILAVKSCFQFKFSYRLVVQLKQNKLDHPTGGEKLIFMLFLRASEGSETQTASLRI